MSIFLWLAVTIFGAPVLGADKFTKTQLDARFPNDLGPAEVDVSSYPKEQQENYTVFKHKCSQCHTLARPINSAVNKRSDWERYVGRMHARSKSKAGAEINKADAAKIVDFLAYDSQIRKVQNKSAFDARSKQLQSLFKEVQAERSRNQQKEGREKASQPSPYTGVK